MDINLLKTYNMSLTEIYKQLSDVDAYDSQYVPKQGASRLKKWILTVITLLISFGLISSLLILAFDPFRKPPQPVVRVEPPVEKPDIVPAPPGYVQIQVIDFIDSAQVVNAQDNETPIDEPADRPANTRPATPRTQTRPAPPVQPSTPRYAIVLAGATPGDYDIISSLAQRASVQAEIVDVQTTIEARWIVYTPQPGTGLRIANISPNGMGAGLGADVEVTPLRNFTVRAEALAYAQGYYQEHGVDTIVVAEEVEHPFYELRVCCMELAAARQFAESTRITDKVFQVRRDR